MGGLPLDVHTVPGNTTTSVIKRLKPSTKYRVVVFGVDKNGTPYKLSSTVNNNYLSPKKYASPKRNDLAKVKTNYDLSSSYLTRSPSSGLRLAGMSAEDRKKFEFWTEVCDYI